MNFQNRFPILLIALFLLAFPVSVSAQNITGAIVGSIKDGSGAARPNATVTLTNVETNAQITIRPDNNGDFVAPSLAPGLYTVKTEATGFKQSVTEAIRLLANRSVRLDIALEPGEITQRVEVQATTPVINSESATIGNILEAEFFNLPNHPNFGNPAANITVPSMVDRIFGAGDPRQIQFGLKVLF